MPGGLGGGWVGGLRGPGLGLVPTTLSLRQISKSYVEEQKQLKER